MKDPVVAAHFESLPQQHQAARLGMWLFVASEVMFFAGLFALYAAYRSAHQADFSLAAHHSNLVVGTINTLVLLTSSLTMALAIHAARSDQTGLSALLVGITALLGAVFLGLKGFEYSQHLHEGISPGRAFSYAGLPERGSHIYFNLYYGMTGLHALHVVIGVVLLAVWLPRVWRGEYGSKSAVGLELVGVYWHLVDLVWLYLWPLFYLVR